MEYIEKKTATNSSQDRIWKLQSNMVLPPELGEKMTLSQVLACKQYRALFSRFDQALCRVG